MEATTYWIEKRCYRFIPPRDSPKLDVEQEYAETLGKSTYIEDEHDDPNIIIIHAGNEFRTTMHVPGVLLGYVNGSYGKNRKALEQRFNTTIKIPHRDNPGAGITIFGSTKSAVSSTYHQIKERVINFRFKEEFTHFVSIPINSLEIQESFQNFKEEILSKYNKTKGIDSSIFQNPRKLHVTITPTVLLDDREKNLAESILKNITENVLKDCNSKEFIVQVKGIEYMNDDPGEVDVLYAKLNEIKGETSLQLLADKIMQEFKHENFSKDKYENVKLHITLMNTLFRDNEKNEENTPRRMTFDARPILKEYLDYDFGEITISEIHLSVFHTSSQSDGYYLAKCKIKLK